MNNDHDTGDVNDAPEAGGGDAAAPEDAKHPHLCDRVMEVLDATVASILDDTDLVMDGKIRDDEQHLFEPLIAYMRLHLEIAKTVAEDRRRAEELPVFLATARSILGTTASVTAPEEAPKRSEKRVARKKVGKAAKAKR